MLNEGLVHYRINHNQRLLKMGIIAMYNANFQNSLSHNVVLTEYKYLMVLNYHPYHYNHNGIYLHTFA